MKKHLPLLFTILSALSFLMAVVSDRFWYHVLFGLLTLSLAISLKKRS